MNIGVAPSGIIVVHHFYGVLAGGKRVCVQEGALQAIID